MRKRGAQLWRWLQDGAQLYVCGNADPMAKDVDRALCDIAAEHGKLDPDAAQGLRPVVERRQALPPRRLLSVLLRFPATRNAAETSRTRC